MAASQSRALSDVFERLSSVEAWKRTNEQQLQSDGGASSSSTAVLEEQLHRYSSSTAAALEQLQSHGAEAAHRTIEMAARLEES